MDRQQGISLIELLVAILLISIGLLGLLSLQLSGVQSSHGSYLRSQATLLADDLIERIRANPPRHNPSGYTPADTTLDYRNLYASFTSSDIDCSAKPTPYCADSILGQGEACNAFEMSTFDFFVSYCGTPKNDTTQVGGIRQTLGAGTVQVDCIDDLTDGNCEPGSLHKITITWLEQAGKKSDGKINQSLAITF